MCPLDHNVDNIFNNVAPTGTQEPVPTKPGGGTAPPVTVPIAAPVESRKTTAPVQDKEITTIPAPVNAPVSPPSPNTLAPVTVPTKTPPTPGGDAPFATFSPTGSPVARPPPVVAPVATPVESRKTTAPVQDKEITTIPAPVNAPVSPPSPNTLAPVTVPTKTPPTPGGDAPFATFSHKEY
jgi:hypothetical protein